LGELIDIEGFAKASGSTRIFERSLDGRVEAAGECNHRDFSRGRVLFDLSADFHAIHAGHHSVEKYGIGAFGSDFEQPFDRTFGEFDLKFRKMLLEEPTSGAQKHCIVIDEQHPLRLRQKTFGYGHVVTAQKLQQNRRLDAAMPTGCSEGRKQPFVDPG